MWWECRDCSEGGNSPKSMLFHLDAHPEHRVNSEVDVPADS